MLGYVVAIFVLSSGHCAAKLPGVTFSAVFSTSTPTNMCLDEPTLKANLQIAGNVADKIRIYTIAQCPQNTRIVLDYARSAGKRVFLGLWVSLNTVTNKFELDWLEDFASQYEDIIDAVVVGNEAVSVQKVSLDDLLSMISQARKVLTNIGVTIPVTTAEIWPLLAEGAGSIIAQASDFICMQIQPFWEGRPVDCGGKGNCIDAAQYVIGKAAEIEALLGKKVVICETGWPTAGEKCCGTRPYSLQGFQAQPSAKNANKYVSDLNNIAASAGREFFYHTVMDGDWKRLWSPCLECLGLATDTLSMKGCGFTGECEVDYHWGILKSNGENKPGFFV